jgi:radical SAM superfamily enzyme YgiQ (UPF0313 family)
MVADVTSDGATSGQLRVLLVNTYDLGHQPFGLASPAAWLRRAGVGVDCLDLSRTRLDPERVRAAGVVAFYVPMHTATRLAVDALREVRAHNPAARICFYGPYGRSNAEHLHALGADAVLSGEFEAELVEFVLAGRAGGPQAPVRTVTSMQKLQFLAPHRAELPPLREYAQLAVGAQRRVVGYTEASRGCRHLCRHCPVVPVYQGRVRIVQADVVLADIAAQVEAGAEHITFGDPDFFNGPAHAARIVSALHDRFPALTYDVTIKVEHLLRHARLLPELARTGCLFVTSAVESVDDAVLAVLQKGHTRAEFVEAVRRCRAAGVAVNPTFVAFHPWTTRESLLDTFALVEALDLVSSLAPVQLTTRLLIPAGSRMLELPELAAILAPFDAQRLVHPWRHRDPAIDALHAEFEALVTEATRAGRDRHHTFDRLLAAAGGTPTGRDRTDAGDVPHFLEPWFCCSEPISELSAGWATTAI